MYDNEPKLWFKDVYTHETLVGNVTCNILVTFHISSTKKYINLVTNDVTDL